LAGAAFAIGVLTWVATLAGAFFSSSELESESELDSFFITLAGVGFWGTLTGTFFSSSELESSESELDSFLTTLVGVCTTFCMEAALTVATFFSSSELESSETGLDCFLDVIFFGTILTTAF